jgi:hypothetical protein
MPFKSESLRAAKSCANRAISLPAVGPKLA